MKPRCWLALASLALFPAARSSHSAETAEEFLASAKIKIAAYDGFGAIADLDRAIAINPKSADLFFERAKAKLAAIDRSHLPLLDAPRPPLDNRALEAGAMADFERAITLKPNFAEAYKARGDARYSSAEWIGRSVDRAAVLADYDKAIKAKPDFFEAYYARAIHRGIASDQTGSTADLEQALAINPDFIPALELRANARRELKNFAGALADLDHAIAVVPTTSPENLAKFREKSPNIDAPGQEKLADLLSSRSLIKRRADDLGGAIADLDRALQLRPTHGYTYRDRAWAKQERGDLIGAVADYGMYKELVGEHAGTRAKNITVVDSTGKRTPLSRSADTSHLYLYFALVQLQKGSFVPELKAIVAEWGEGLEKTAGLYLTGAVDESALLKKAREGDAATIARQECQAFYYIGMRRLITRQPAEAKEFFQRALAAEQRNLNEFRFARAELKRLENEN